MKNIRELFIEYSARHKAVFMFSFVVLFFTLFDSTMSYITPLLIQERGFSLSVIGFVVGTSSMVGALFDFLISKVFKKIQYKRTFMIMFAICAVYPFLLWQAKTLWFFVFVMAIWGVYFDLYGFGVFNFIGKYTKKENYSSGFGIVQIFRALGQMLGPLLVGLVIVDVVNWKAFSLGWFYLVVAVASFVVLLLLMKKKKNVNGEETEYPRRKNFLIEFHLWKKISRTIAPVLLLTFFLFFVEGFFWTIGPLYATSSSTDSFGGLFLTAYTLPSILVGWFIGYFTKKFGKKRTAFWGLLIGSLMMTLFYFSPSFLTSTLIVFIASFFISISLPAINSSYADYITETPQVENEIEGLEDFAFNLGYVFGPITAGILAQAFSIEVAFSILGVLGIILAVLLLFLAPRRIKINISKSEL